jgi:hypothetical protein
MLRYSAKGDPDDFLRDERYILETTCLTCGRTMYHALHKLPLTEETQKSEVEFWKRRYTSLITCLNEHLKQIEIKHNCNPALLLWHETLLKLRAQIIQNHETGETDL